MWVVVYIKHSFSVLYKGVPYYFGELNKDPNVENYLCAGLKLSQVMGRVMDHKPYTTTSEP